MSHSFSGKNLKKKKKLDEKKNFVLYLIFIMLNTIQNDWEPGFLENQHSMSWLFNWIWTGEKYITI